MSLTLSRMVARVALTDHLPQPGGDVFEAFLGWTQAQALELYPAQEEAILELFSGRHVILNTPTGSGKTLVATAMVFKALAEGNRVFYTSPIKALVAEKFFEWCELLGAERVGMMTGDASVNAKAPLVCCTAEVLANVALREGIQAPIDCVIMDEFHFYADPDRGRSWQLPLLILRSATFLLMSATLGDVSLFETRMQAFTGRDVALVRSAQRPVPLHFEYRETTLHETIADYIRLGRAPIYVVSFTQRECAELAQALTSAQVATKEERAVIQEGLQHTRFDTTYGKDVKRFLSHGVGIHHAGLLPKYRRVVERLAQQGALRVVCGTDTLGVGINIPIRSVVFTKLCKFDGAQTRILSVRDFKQIAGRAGRRGFDTEGFVAVQAPEHVVENKKLEAKHAGGKKKFVRKQAPERGYVAWNEATLERLRNDEPESLVSRFGVDHGLLLSVLGRDIDASRLHGGYRTAVELIERSYEREGGKRRLRRQLTTLFADLRRAKVVEVVPCAVQGRPAVRLSQGLQRDFSLYHTLSLYLLAALAQLDPADERYALHVLTLVEAVLESPRAILLQQVQQAKTERMAELKAEGVEYEARMRELEAVEHPKPDAGFIYDTFDRFRLEHPWVGSENVRPKSIARDMLERYMGFNEYVNMMGIGRMEGLLLRYLTQAYKTLAHNVPEQYKDDRVQDVEAYLRATLARVDASLLHEWQGLAAGHIAVAELPDEDRLEHDPSANPRAFAARVRAELWALVRALAERDFDEAACAVFQDPHDPWPAPRFEASMRAFEEEHGPLVFNHAARAAKLTTLKQMAPRVWDVTHILCDNEGETTWVIEGCIDLTELPEEEGPLVRVARVFG